MSKANMPILYRWFKIYLKFLSEKVYYRKVHYLDTENIPSDGTPLLIVSDHQNAMNDAFGVLMSMWDRVVHFIVRADVFALHPVANKFLRSIGLLPAFRLNYEGEGALKNNDATFRVSEQSLIDGNTVVIYPEAGHQDKHWLGTFSYGYTKMAFDAAALGNFEKEVFILPSCNHYSQYRGLRTDAMVRYGKPISLKPYYELYKTKPRTAQREVNALVREQIKGMMLNIEDLENYDAIDYIRQSPYGEGYAKSLGLDPDNLPQKLEADKKLVAALADAKAKDENKVQSVYQRVSGFSDKMKNAGVADRNLDSAPKTMDVVLQILVLIVLSPLAVFALWPSVFSWFIPKHFSDKAEDKMFSGTFLIALNALFIFPIFGLLTLIVTWVKYSFVTALIYVALFPALCLFEWTYANWIKELIQDLKAMKAAKSGELSRLAEERQELYNDINDTLKI